MTRDEILAMNPGRELDMLIAKKVMGWNHTPAKVLEIYEWNPTTNISAAWEVENKMIELCKEDDYAFELLIITGADETSAGIKNLNVFKIAHASPEQRCKAALLAVLE